MFATCEATVSTHCVRTEKGGRSIEVGKAVARHCGSTDLWEEASLSMQMSCQPLPGCVFRLFLLHSRAKELNHPRGQLVRNTSGCAVYTVSFYRTALGPVPLADGLDLFCNKIAKASAADAPRIVLWRCTSNLSTTSTARQRRLECQRSCSVSLMQMRRASPVTNHNPPCVRPGLCPRI